MLACKLVSQCVKEVERKTQSRAVLQHFNNAIFDRNHLEFCCQILKLLPTSKPITALSIPVLLANQSAVPHLLTVCHPLWSVSNRLLNTFSFKMITITSLVHTSRMSKMFEDFKLLIC